MNEYRTCTERRVELAHYVPQAFTGWRPIETAPKDRQILLWYPWLLDERKGAPPGFMFIGRWYFADDGNDRWIDDEGDDIGAECTHWMPLPEPPK